MLGRSREEEGQREEERQGSGGRESWRSEFQQLWQSCAGLAVLQDMNRLSTGNVHGVTGWGQQVLPVRIEIHQLRFLYSHCLDQFFFIISFFFLYSIFWKRAIILLEKGSCVSSVSKWSLKY